MRWMTLICALGVLAIAGCGGSSNSEKSAGSGSSSNATSTPTATSASSSGGGGQTLKLAADKSALKFDTSTLKAKAGTVTLQMANPAGIPHAVAVQGNGVDKDGKTVGNGGTSTVTVKLKPGKYEFYCPVDGHKAAGMKGTLTVS